MPIILHVYSSRALTKNAPTTPSKQRGILLDWKKNLNSKREPKIIQTLYDFLSAPLPPKREYFIFKVFFLKKAIKQIILSLKKGGHNCGVVGLQPQKKIHKKIIFCLI